MTHCVLVTEVHDRTENRSRRMVLTRCVGAWWGHVAGREFASPATRVLAKQNTAQGRRVHSAISEQLVTRTRKLLYYYCARSIDASDRASERTSVLARLVSLIVFRLRFRLHARLLSKSDEMFMTTPCPLHYSPSTKTRVCPIAHLHLLRILLVLPGVLRRTRGSVWHFDIYSVPLYPSTKHPCLVNLPV